MKTPEELAEEHIKFQWGELWPRFDELTQEMITDVAMKAFLAGYAAANRWRSVERELPADGAIVLTLSEDGQRISSLNTNTWNNGHTSRDWKNEGMDSCGCCDRYNEKITHWLPLPPLPTK